MEKVSRPAQLFIVIYLVAYYIFVRSHVGLVMHHIKKGTFSAKSRKVGIAYIKYDRNEG